MSDIIRWVNQYLWGTKYVVITDFDGEEHVRRVKFVNGVYRVYRGYSGSVTLHDDGTTTGISFVKYWRPYVLFSKPTKKLTYKGEEV